MAIGNPHLFDEDIGLLKSGTITNYNSTTGKMYVQLNNTGAGAAPQIAIVNAPQALWFNNGIYIGSKPTKGTTVVLGVGASNQYYFVSFLAEKISALPLLKDNELLIQSNDITKITLNKKTNDIYLGSQISRIHINGDTSLLTTNFDDEQHFTQASRQINGLIRRDKTISTSFDLNTRLSNDNYDKNYTIIALDPTVSPTFSSSRTIKNPPFVESHEIVYEFQESSEVGDDLSESSFYGKSPSVKPTFSKPNRRKSKADAFSLTLSSPNYLIETIKGSGVDIFGNLLDLNRNIIPIGKDQATLNSTISKDLTQSFLQIKALERKNLAYHFELNARKDLHNNPININSVDNYARNRSRFFFDIDKEGQFKLNVPASSETGNVPTLVRYENFTNISNDDNNNPNKLIYRQDYIDIFQDSFAAPKRNLTTFELETIPGSIDILNEDGYSQAVDRINGKNIRYGTAYHDILSTCFAHQTSNFLQYQYDPPEFQTIDVASIPIMKNVVSSAIQTSGVNANAGGRSGNFSFDGSIDLNIGANTIDRSSILFDTAGSIIGNIGRDRQNKSAAISMDGDCYLQIGSFGVAGDSRFDTLNNGLIGGVLDLRIMTSGKQVHMIRVDDKGITIMTPQNIAIHAAGDIKLTSSATIEIEAENLILQRRLVNKLIGGSI